MANNQYIGLYKDNPTAGATDGTRVSENSGAGATSPVSVTLNATNNEISSPIKLALRCEASYQTTGTTDISLVDSGTGNASKWALVLKDGTDTQPTQTDIDNATYGGAVSITDVIGTGNYIIWAIAKATDDEDPQNDESVDIQVTATIEATA
ncbi:MAG: hypothetical protein FH756_15845 [Firmicutes bacterium]|nr:hypothetical protein [Bacillota bacterium]